MTTQATDSNGTALAMRDQASIMEQVIAKGDLAQLSPKERVTYYREVCRSLGLNELTQPFGYIVLNGKMTLYPLKGCTDQLRRIHHVNITRIEREQIGDIYVVTAYATCGDRTDSEIGAVPIAGLRGEALANAMMKSITKAKRRVTLAICGLGWTDESEIESIPGAHTVVVDSTTGEFLEERRAAPPAKPEPDTEVEMVTSGDSRIWKRWLDLKGQADALGIPFPELRLPVPKDTLANRGQRLFEKIEERKQQLASEDAARAVGEIEHETRAAPASDTNQQLVTDKSSVQWKLWLDAERRARGANLDIDTSQVKLGSITREALEASIAGLEQMIADAKSQGLAPEQVGAF